MLSGLEHFYILQHSVVCNSLQSTIGQLISINQFTKQERSVQEIGTGNYGKSGGSVRRRRRGYGYTRGTGGRCNEGSVQHEYKPRGWKGWRSEDKYFDTHIFWAYLFGPTMFWILKTPDHLDFWKCPIQRCLGLEGSGLEAFYCKLQQIRYILLLYFYISSLLNFAIYLSSRPTTDRIASTFQMVVRTVLHSA